MIFFTSFYCKFLFHLFSYFPVFWLCTVPVVFIFSGNINTSYAILNTCQRVYTPIWGHSRARVLSIFTLGTSSLTSHGRNSWAVVTLTRYSIMVSLHRHTHRCICTSSCLYVYFMTVSQTDDERPLQVISQAIHAVDHGFPWWCHTAEKTGGSESQLYLLPAILRLCVFPDTNTDLRLPPSASTPRQILKADAPLVV